MPVVPTHLIPFRDACDAFLRSGCIPPPEKHELKDLRVLNISLKATLGILFGVVWCTRGDQFVRPDRW